MLKGVTLGLIDRCASISFPAKVAVIYYLNLLNLVSYLSAKQLLMINS